MIRICMGMIGLLLLLGGCSNTRFLAGDQLLYTGQKKIQISQEPVDMPSAVRRQLLQSGSAQRPNNSVFDRRVLPPVGLWVHNYWKKEERGKFGSWLYRTLSAPPVLVSDINPELMAQKIENDLFDQGYFQARAWSGVDTSSRNPRKARVQYFVEVGPAYHYGEIRLDHGLMDMDSLVNAEDFHDQIKTGDQFDIRKLTEARAGISRQFQELGYYRFNTDFIELNADTALSKNQLNLELRRRRELSPDQLSRYRIGSIEVHVSRPSDTLASGREALPYEGILIHSAGDEINPGVIHDALYFSSGDLYSYTAHQRTMARLNNLGVFSYVRIEYRPSVPDSLPRILDVHIELHMADQINLHLETDLVMKSTGYMGPGVTLGVSSTNTFKAAERIQVDLKGGLEWQWGSRDVSQIGTFSYEFGVNSSLSVPTLRLPWRHQSFRNLINQETSVNLNFDMLNRTEYYSMFSALTSLKYSWGKTQSLRHSFSPVYLNSVSLLATTPVFDSIAAENIYIQKSFEEQFIFGIRYEFNYDNTHRRRPQNVYFSMGASSSGNLLDVLAGIGKEGSERPHTILNTVYAQHLKLTTDFRYYLNGYNKTLATRLYAGLGIPYRNSTVLPYVEQFFSGGAYSIRGFTARTLGPGSFHEEENTYIDQSGDIKLEANLEFRFGISRITKGALFMDVGNIWLHQEDEQRPGSQFHFDSFYRQLAVGAGFGLRFDFNFFVLRTDFGIPIRTPYVQDDSYWLTGQGNLLSNTMFYFAIGYPF